MNFEDDTIVSKVTPDIQCNIGIIRISGSSASKVSVKILKRIPSARYASYLPFFDMSGRILDYGIALWFPSPHSFTGEDVLELQGHGNPIIMDLLICNILSIPNTRLAKPGEFSERAFLNEKIDLVQAESIVDLINATSEKAVHAAVKSLQGVFSCHINRLIKKINNFRVMIETSINFSEDEVNISYEQNIVSNIDKIIDLLENTYNMSTQGVILRKGIKVVICGHPNSGKSSLLNSLLCTNRAIVTDIPGTTRDVIYERISINGLLFNLVDTAGLRLTNHVIERIGIEFAWKEINLADHILYVVDGSSNYNNQIETYTNFIKTLSNNVSITVIFNKSDLQNFSVNTEHLKTKNYMCTSTKIGKGIKELRKHLYNTFKINNFFCNNENIFLARQRHINILLNVLNFLRTSKNNWIQHGNIELLAEDMLFCQNQLNNITGCHTSDQLLSDIFSKFCIGK